MESFCFEFHDFVEVLRLYSLVVLGEVVACGSVINPADGFEQGFDGFFGSFGGSTMSDMFEEVGESVFFRFFVYGTDFVSDGM